MKRNLKIAIFALLLILFLLAWAPWLNDKEIHDKVLKERGWKDGTITTVEHFKELDNETLQKLIEDSRRKGVENGILICDYEVKWFPFGRIVWSCEGVYFVTFWGQIFP